MTSLKAKLRGNRLTIGSWLTIGHPAIVEIMSSAGFDWLAIDMEHSAIDIQAAMSLIPLIQATGMKALVRVSKNEEVVIKRILDLGADGIIVPMVNSRQSALDAVAFAKYPPVGNRGAGLYRAQQYGTHFKEYTEWVAEELVIIAQIEHIEAVNNLADILTVPDIDATIIGPYDLSASLGIPGSLDDPQVRNAIARVEEECQKQGKPIGAHVIPPEHSALEEKVECGYTFLAFSLDSLLLGGKVRDEMNAFYAVKE